MGKRKKKTVSKGSDRSESTAQEKDTFESGASFSEVNRPLSLVAQVEQSLRTAIEEGMFPNSRLPTLVDLADQLRVSRETVRLALDSLQREGLIVKHRRRGTFVSESTAPRVLKAPERKVLGYLLEEFESGGADSELISRPHGSAMLEGAIMEAGRRDYHIVAGSSKPYQLRETFDQLNELGPLSGTIFACVAEEKLLKRLSGRNMPAVLLDHEMHLPKVGSVRGDSQQNASLAINHLAKLGHRRIACAHWRQSDLNPWFLKGYRQGMRKEGLQCRRAWEWFVELNERGALEVVSKIMNMPSRPTAIVCFHNTFASQLVVAASQKGYRIPDDLSIMGGGGEDIVNLTSTHLDWHDLGRTAVRLLVNAINQGKSHRAEHVLVPYELKTGLTAARLESTS